MTCFHPLSAFQLDDGKIVFSERGAVRRQLTLACGRCRGCRLSRARSWAIRCMHEASLQDANAFVTLTYDKENYQPSLCYRDFQLFMKRLRKRYCDTRVRFFTVGEYGESSSRPHFHSLMFNVRFNGLQKVAKNLYSSRDLSELWPHGFAAVGGVSFQSAAYCARYALKKVNGAMADEYYKRVNVVDGSIVDVVPEFAHMSLKPGIGFRWFEKYWRDVYLVRDGVVVNGKTVPAPKYYDKLLEVSCPDLREDKDFDRYVKSKEFEDDCTPERLLAREIVAKARSDLYKRNLL